MNREQEIKLVWIIFAVLIIWGLIAHFARADYIEVWDSVMVVDTCGEWIFNDSHDTTKFGFDYMYSPCTTWNYVSRKVEWPTRPPRPFIAIQSHGSGCILGGHITVEIIIITIQSPSLNAIR
jgi:hypothetical protein